MNFKEQYRSAFSEIQASEETITRICEVTMMKGINESKARAAKSKKIFISMLAAAIFTATSAVAVSAGAMDDMFGNIRMYINGEEVSASDYIAADTVKIEDGGNVVTFDMDELPEDSVVYIQTDEGEDGSYQSSVIVSNEVAAAADSDSGEKTVFKFYEIYDK